MKDINYYCIDILFLTIIMMIIEFHTRQIYTPYGVNTIVSGNKYKRIKQGKAEHPFKK